jgi:hypothetical protein
VSTCSRKGEEGSAGLQIQYKKELKFEGRSNEGIVDSRVFEGKRGRRKCRLKK